MINTNEIYLDLIKYLSNESEGSTKTCLGLIRIAERIGWLRYYFKQQTNVTTTALLKLIIQRFKNLFA